MTDGPCFKKDKAESNQTCTHMYIYTYGHIHIHTCAHTHVHAYLILQLLLQTLDPVSQLNVEHKPADVLESTPGQPCPRVLLKDHSLVLLQQLEKEPCETSARPPVSLSPGPSLPRESAQNIHSAGQESPITDPLSPSSQTSGAAPQANPQGSADASLTGTPALRKARSGTAA